MQYGGKLYGKHGRKYFPMILTAENVDRIEKERSDAISALKIIASYDKDSNHGKGCCDYGCYCPSIAQDALSKMKDDMT